MLVLYILFTLCTTAYGPKILIFYSVFIYLYNYIYINMYIYIMYLYTRLS